MGNVPRRKGEPYKFTPTRRDQYLELLREGGRRAASARQIGIDPATIRTYAKEHPEFAIEIDKAEMEANEVVEDALYQAAISGNVVAAQVWLYNREPDRWQDQRRVAVGVTGRVDVDAQVDHKVSIDTEHLDDEVERSLKRLADQMRDNERAREQNALAPAESDPGWAALRDAGNIIEGEVLKDEADPALVEHPGPR